MIPRDGAPLAEIEAARTRLKEFIVPTPVVPLHLETTAFISLKLENLQPIGSFKLRGAGNAILKRRDAVVSKGVYTASAGNMAQGVAWFARQVGAACHAVVPDTAPAAKLNALEEMGTRIIKVSFDEWWQVMETHHYPGLDAVFIHPVSDPDVIAGNGTIGLEIAEAVPDVDTVLVPFGGGGLSTGIASALRAVKPSAKVFACEVETAAPFAASLAAGEPVSIEHTRSFVDGIGGKSVLKEMWPATEHLLAGSRVTSVEKIAHAVRTLVTRNRVVVEGAGATPVAVALTGEAGRGNVVCVVSGGNIDTTVLETILHGQVP